MITVRKTSVFPATKKEVFKRLQRLRTLQYIAYPLATFTPVNGNNKQVGKQALCICGRSALQIIMKV